MADAHAGHCKKHGRGDLYAASGRERAKWGFGDWHALVTGTDAGAFWRRPPRPPSRGFAKGGGVKVLWLRQITPPPLCSPHGGDRLATSVCEHRNASGCYRTQRE